MFLWAAVGLSIPILIALWNRRRHKKEAFGAYFLLRRFSRQSKRKIRLLELIKLLNRLALLALLIVSFAQPFVTRNILSEAGEGFVLFVDVGRDLQRLTVAGEPATQVVWRELQRVLDQMPSQSQGVVAWVSNRCELVRLPGGALTGRPRDFRANLSLEAIPFSGRQLRTEALQQCHLRAQSLFGEREIYQTLLSPLSSSLSEDALKRMGFDLRQIEVRELPELQAFRLSQERVGDSVELVVDTPPERDLVLISSSRRLTELGRVQRRTSIPTGSDLWAWFRAQIPEDAWWGQRIEPIDSETRYELSLWAENQSQGLQSLFSALRNHPRLEVQLQIGSQPEADSVIVYGSRAEPVTGASRVWYFLSPGERHPFSERDQKQWSVSAVSEDLRRSFTIESPEGNIFVRRYLLLSLDRLESLESFQDGAPSLMRDLSADERRWITPFDLEDLTTDLTLEAAFIPYLYRKLEDWFGERSLGEEEESWENIFALPGRVAPHPSVLDSKDWPGIYRSQGGYYQLVFADDPSESFLEISSFERRERERQEQVPLRAEFFPWIIFCVFLELALCAGMAGMRSFFFLAFFLMSFGEQELYGQTRQIQVGYLSGMESNRVRALSQLVEKTRSLSNLDLSPPQQVQMDELWRFSIIFSSSTEPLSLSSRDQARLREYLERGGLLVFDDPLAQVNTQFFLSVRDGMEEIFPGRSFQNLSRDHVIYRTYYLLREVSGRRLASPHLQVIHLDDRAVVIFSSNDLLGAQLRSSAGDFALAVSPYGPVQRTLSLRLLVNLMMYSVTGDYKDDAIHLPHILQRRMR